MGESHSGAKREQASIVCPQGLNKTQRLTGQTGHELKPRSEGNACWRRWVTASKETRVFFAGYGLFTMIAICGLASQFR